MNIHKEELYITITPKNNSDFSYFFKKINEVITDFKEQNIIVDLSQFEVSNKQISQFEKISTEKIELGTSFVIINKEANLDEISDELIIVPSFQEAVDIIEMDEMTRSLDF